MCIRSRPYGEKRQELRKWPAKDHDPHSPLLLSTGLSSARPLLAHFLPLPEQMVSASITLTSVPGMVLCHNTQEPGKFRECPRDSDPCLWQYILCHGNLSAFGSFCQRTLCCHPWTSLPVSLCLQVFQTKARHDFLILAEMNMTQSGSELPWPGLKWGICKNSPQISVKKLSWHIPFQIPSSFLDPTHQSQN